MSTGKLVLTRAAGAVRHIQLNDRKRMNALSAEMIRQLSHSLKEGVGRQWAKARVVVISGAHPVFSSGHNLKELKANVDSSDKEANLSVFESFSELVGSIRSAPLPVIAKVDGLAAAAGCQLVASCDMAFASRRSTFSTPGVRFGLFCTTPGVALSRAISQKLAMQMLFTGQPIDADRAVTAGLLSAVASDAAELDTMVEEVCADICSLSAEVIAHGKRAFFQQISTGTNLDAAYSLASKEMVDNLSMHDCIEGLNAFGQKRSPQWN